MPLYVDTYEESAEIDVNAISLEIQAVETELEATRTAIDAAIKELGS